MKQLKSQALCLLVSTVGYTHTVRYVVNAVAYTVSTTAYIVSSLGYVV